MSFFVAALLLSASSIVAWHVVSNGHSWLACGVYALLEHFMNVKCLFFVQNIHVCHKMFNCSSNVNVFAQGVSQLNSPLNL